MWTQELRGKKEWNLVGKLGVSCCSLQLTKKEPEITATNEHKFHQQVFTTEQTIARVRARVSCHILQPSVHMVLHESSSSNKGPSNKGTSV